MAVIKLVIVDDSPTDTYVMQRVFGKNPSFKVVHVFNNGVDFLKNFHQLPDFDCVLIDMHLPKMSGKEVILELQARNVPFKIYVMTYGLFPSLVQMFNRSGAHAFSRKDPQVLEMLLPKVAAGDLIYEDQANDIWNVNGVDMNNFEMETHVWMGMLTHPEKAILNGFANGLSIPQISAKSGIDIEILDKHHKKIMKKLRFKHDEQLKQFAIKHGFADES